MEITTLHRFFSNGIKNLEHFVLFVCSGIVGSLDNFSLMWRRHHYRQRAVNFDLCSALMAIEQWGFFSVPHLLWHRTSLYNGHLRGPVKLTSVAERLAVDCHYQFLQLRFVAVEIRTPNLPMRGERSNPLHHRSGLTLCN